METCLQPLWNVLRDDNVLSLYRDENNINAYRKKMEDFFWGLQDNLNENHREIKKPEHIEKYIRLLEANDKQMLKQGIKDIKIRARNCGMCAVCRGCSQKFYEDVEQESILEKSLPCELENYFLSKPQMYYYQERMNEKNERVDLKDKFFLLKGFSSSTPTIYSAAFDTECVGGGFYLNYKGTGIVVDPGMGFVASMHKIGIFINDVDIVIVTHDHLDHNADAETLSSLVYDFNNYNQRKKRIVYEVLGTRLPLKHKITWIVDENTKMKLQGKVDDLRSIHEYLGDNGKEIIIGNKGILLSSINTKHLKEGNESYGIKLRLLYDKEVSLGYTSDTSYFEELASFFSDEDILIFNVSDMYKKDVQGIKGKDTHLGYDGSIKLLKRANYKIGIASEFCCTNGDFRIDFIKTIKKELGRRINGCILPGEIGFNIFLPGLQFECTICKRKTEAKQMYVVSPQKEYGKIQYICRQCASSVI